MKNIKIEKQTKHVDLKLNFYSKRFLIILGVILSLLIIWKVIEWQN